MDADDAGADPSSTALRAKLSAYALPSSSSRVASATSSRAPSASPRKRARKEADSQPAASPTKKAKRGYAPPETYAHLGGVHDHLAPDLDVVFCGINPGQTSAETGHHFAHPTNRFWRCLAEARLTPRLYSPTEDATLPATCQIGITNLVSRPTAEAAELSPAEMRAAAPALLAKLAHHAPKLVVFVGKVNWTHVWHALAALSAGRLEKPKAKGTDAFGLQPAKLVHARGETLLYVVPSTSGLCRVKHTEMVALFAGAKDLAERLKEGEVDTAHMVGISVPEEISV